MIKILLGIIILSFCCCSKSSAPEANMELAARAIIGMPPENDLHVDVLKSDFVKMSYTSPPNDVLAWIYRWPVAGDNFKHLGFGAFLNEANQLLADKRYMIVYNNSIGHSIDGKLDHYGVECVITLESKSIARCTIKCSKL